MNRKICALLLATTFTLSAPLVSFAADEAVPEISLDASPAIVNYKLKRLSNGQLLAIPRKADDPKHKLLFAAILTRKGIDRKFRQEAVEGLAKINKTDPVVELLEGIGKVEEEDKSTPRELIGLLLAQKPEALAAQREKIETIAKESDKDLVKQAAYAALATADGKPDKVWDLAGQNEGGTKHLLTGLPLVAAGKTRATFYDKVKPLVAQASDEATQVAAIEAVSTLPGNEAEVFKTLAGLVTAGQGTVRDAAIRSIRKVPAGKWPKDQVEPLAKAVVKLVSGIPQDKRTEPAAIVTVQLGEDLSNALPPEQGGPIRKSLRELSVRVVLVQTYREQMKYDLRYFVVQKGKPVQVVLENDDAMPHNIVFTQPGAMQEVATAGSMMPPPADEKDKAFVPASPKVLEATHLVQPGESGAITFNAPAKAGEYPFVCTYPGHWAVGMYGVMLVVDDIDAYEEDPVAPKDPLTKKVYDKQKNENLEAAPGQPAAHQH